MQCADIPVSGRVCAKAWRNRRIPCVKAGEYRLPAMPIDAAIREHFRDNVLSKKAVQSVTEQYGFDRTMYVLAVTVLDRDGDGRISQSNRNWAKMQPIFADPDDRGNERNRAFVVRAHPGLTDLFLREVRHEKAASLEKKMQQPKKQKSEMER